MLGEDEVLKTLDSLDEQLPTEIYHKRKNIFSSQDVKREFSNRTNMAIIKT
jgi:hypothetical protein